MNKTILIGRITKDIDLRKTQSGKSVITFTLAVNREYKNADGGYDADFFNCVSFGQQAETIQRFVHKGDRFGIVGRLQNRSYEKDGTKHIVTEVFVDSFEFLESKKTDKLDDFVSKNNDFVELTDEDADLPF